jgi:hypothetical protein
VYFVLSRIKDKCDNSIWPVAFWQPCQQFGLGRRDTCMRVLRIIVGFTLMLAGGALLGWAAGVEMVGIGPQFKPLESATFIAIGFLVVASAAGC